MNPHLNDREFAEWMLGTSPREIAEHIRTCAVCEAEATQVRGALSLCRESIVAAADRDQMFWTKQRAAIGKRLRRQQRPPALRWALVAMSIIVLVGALLLVRATQPAARASADSRDDILLQQIQTDVERDYPAALGPAVLIDQERSLALSSSTGVPLSAAEEKEQHR